jgi:hypothetical protein
MNLSKSINDFQQLQNNALDKYSAKFIKISKKAQKIIHKIDIEYYSETNEL